MTTVEDKAERGVAFLDGEPGASLFHRVLFRPIGPSEMPDLLQKTEHADDRVSAIVSALVVENRLDRLLRAWLPGFKALSTNRDFTTAMRIAVLRAAVLVPEDILRCADIARQVRNEFAHDLANETIEQTKYVDKIRTLHIEIWGPKSTVEEGTVRRMFQHLVFYAVAGLDGFTANLTAFSAMTREPAFEEGLRVKAHAEQHERFVVAMAKGPDRVEIQGPLLIEHYDDCELIVVKDAPTPADANKAKPAE